MHWAGDYLDTFPKYIALNDTDLEYFLAWVESKEVEAFLNDAIEDCKIQSKVNRAALGYAVIEKGKGGVGAKPVMRPKGTV